MIGEELSLTKILVSNGKIKDYPETYTKVSEVIDIGETGTGTCDDFLGHGSDIIMATGGIVTAEDGQQAVLICGGHMQVLIVALLDHCNYAYKDSNHMFDEVDMIYGNRAAAASLVIDSGLKLWITGGKLQTSKLDSTEYVSLSPTPASHKGPELLEGMSSHCIVRLSSSSLKALLIGGDNEHVSPDYRTWYFDENTQNLWSDGPGMIYGRANLGCGVLLDKEMDQELVLVAGGIETLQHGSTSVEYLWLNSNNNQWNLGQEVLCNARVGSASIVPQDKSRLILVGGLHKNGIMPNQQSLCSCIMAGGNPSCKIMSQQLRIGRAFMTAMLIPDSFTTCTN